MSEKYKIRNPDNAYFITSTTEGWIDIFTRKNNKQVIVDSLNYCVKNKGLIIYSWCLMSNHLHMICKSEGDISLSDILRDFKTFTSKQIAQNITQEPESRREWMYAYFKKSVSHLKRAPKYKIWQNGNHPKEITGSVSLYQKIEYIHNNPVKEMLVENAWEYLHSSARDYSDKKGLVEVCVLGHNPLISNWQ